MLKRRSVFRTQKRQIALLVALALTVFIFLMGRQGIATSVAVANGYAYTAVGRHGGVRILDVRNPMDPVEVGYYDTPGQAYRVTIVDNHLFVADGREGLRIIEVSDPRMPVVIGVLQTGGDVRDVVVSGNYAYLADGRQGLAVVDVSNRTRPFVVNHVPLRGFARAVELVEVTALVPGTAPDVPGSWTVLPAYAYVAAERSGMHVVDIRLPASPRLLHTYDPPGEVQDIAVSGRLGLVAAGRGGLRLVNITNPAEPDEYGALEAEDEVRAVTIHGDRAYVAAGEQGVYMLDLTRTVSLHEGNHLQTPGAAQDLAADDLFLYIADGVWGLRIVDAINMNNPDRTGHYETPGEASASQVLNGASALLSRQMGEVQEKVWRTLLITIFDIVLFVAVFLFWIFVYAQFVLPVHTLRERRQATERLLLYALGRHGRAVFIQNGEIRQNVREKDRYGPGVVLLDTASAAVLRSPHAFTRAVGPGVAFTKASEYPAGSVDLHRQSRSLGPPHGEDPFADHLPDETLEEFEGRQRRRYETSGLTRDGVEVVPYISVGFCIWIKSSGGMTQFGFDPASVWNAIAGEGVNLNALPDGQARNLVWQQLPMYLAVDLWREYLRKFTIDELFTFGPAPGNDPDTERCTAYDTIQEMVRQRLMEPEVDDLNEIGQPSGEKVPSQEYEMLRSRGLQVMSVSVRSLRFPHELEEQLVDQWQASWLYRAQEERKDVERIHSRERIRGEEQAGKEFAVVVSQPLASLLLNNPHASQGESLEALLQGTLKLAVREPDLSLRLTNQKNALVEIIEWIRKHKT